MTIQRMERVGIVVDDLAAATEFFVERGLELQGEGPSKAAGWTVSWGLRAMMQTPDGHGRLELTKFHSPSTQGDNRQAPANIPVSATSRSHPRAAATLCRPADRQLDRSASAFSPATRAPSGARPVQVVGSVTLTPVTHTPGT
jgi:hypothetical protein